MQTPRLQQAYYSATIAEFLRQAPQTILGYLAQHHAHDLDPLQRNTWLTQFDLLQRELPALSDGWIGFEFSIPRMGKRADAIVLHQGLVFVLEFKIGAESFTAAAIDQVIDYALDLKNFHEGSYSRIIVPVLIATDAAPKPVQLTFFPNADDRVAEPVFSNGQRLGEGLVDASRRFAGEPVLEPLDWLASGYKPTPTIVEAARWQSVKSDAAQKYLANAYRVLLTRARQGMVIYVPRGDAADPTRPPAFYDGIADYLAQCGIAPL